ncbi:hypothetical protein H0H92_002335 [Tricholoma furcatifolium]|nr:hypothetical protein H0H92_002335 [Tricholoma furcatifolium]
MLPAMLLVFFREVFQRQILVSRFIQVAKEAIHVVVFTHTPVRRLSKDTAGTMKLEIEKSPGINVLRLQ